MTTIGGLEVYEKKAGIGGINIVLKVKTNVSCPLKHVCSVNKTNVCQAGRNSLGRRPRVYTLERREVLDGTLEGHQEMWR